MRSPSLPRFCDETGELPRFGFEDRTEEIELVEVLDDAPPLSLAPVALDASDLEDDLDEEPQLHLTPPTFEEPSGGFSWKPLAIAAVALIGVVGLGFATRSPNRATFLAAAIEPPPVAAPPAPVTVAPAPPPRLEPPPVVAPVPTVPTKGTLVTPTWAKGRRVWIDGKLVAARGPKLEATCGKHVVKIGTYGKSKKVDVPCGGELRL